MVMGQLKESKLSEEEIKIRQEEDKLFQEISAPATKLDDVSGVLGDD
jgi:hypothetical protein